MKLGVFDSGIGGEAVARDLQSSFPTAKIISVNDSKNLPYGNKPLDTIIKLTDTAIQPLLSANCDIIILACNTATAAAIDTLRERYPMQKFIGLEPMLKTAAILTKSGSVTLCATPATLTSPRYNALKRLYTSDITVVEPDCSDWATLIEHNQLSRAAIEAIVNDSCEQGSDVIVLGCTHYHWIKDVIIEIAADRAAVIDPTEAISRRISDLMRL